MGKEDSEDEEYLDDLLEELVLHVKVVREILQQLLSMAKSVLSDSKADDKD